MLDKVSFLFIFSLEILENIHEESVKAAICSFKPYKSPGRDGIYPVLLQKGINSLKKILVTLYRKSITEGVIPSSWMKSRIAFIPKPGKSDACSPKSFRPITLSSFLLKGLKKSLNNTLTKTSSIRKTFFIKIYTLTKREFQQKMLCIILCTE